MPRTLAVVLFGFLLNIKIAFAAIPWRHLYSKIGGRNGRSALRCNRAPRPIESICLFLLLAGNLSVS